MKVRFVICKVPLCLNDRSLNSENPGDLFLINLLNAWVLDDGAVFGIYSLSSSVTSSLLEF
jgi:hypothetical protein